MSENRRITPLFFLGALLLAAPCSAWAGEKAALPEGPENVSLTVNETVLIPKRSLGD